MLLCLFLIEIFFTAVGFESEYVHTKRTTSARTLQKDENREDMKDQCSYPSLVWMLNYSVSTAMYDTVRQGAKCGENPK